MEDLFTSRAGMGRRQISRCFGLQFPAFLALSHAGKVFWELKFKTSEVDFLHTAPLAPPMLLLETYYAKGTANAFPVNVALSLNSPTFDYES